MRGSRGAASPLVVAALAFAVGGFGNVAFSLHSGSQGALAVVRFAVGALLAGAFVWGWSRRSVEGVSPIPRGAWRYLVVASACEACAIALLMAAADYASTVVFTVVGLCAPAVTALAGRPLGLPRATWLATGLAGGALVAAGGAAWAGSVAGLQVTWLGLGLAAGSMVFAALSAVAGSVAVRSYHPAVLVALSCVFGLVVVSVWLVWGGQPFVLVTSTVVAAVFIALVPGGVAKVAWLWANGRSSPQLVQSMVAMAVVTALLGGWVLLGERPSVWVVVLSVVAAVLVAVLALLRAPTR